jgi:hypothetical protein
VLPLAVLARPRWRDVLIWQIGEVVYFVAIWWHLAGITAGAQLITDEQYVWTVGVEPNTTIVNTPANPTRAPFTMNAWYFTLVTLMPEARAAVSLPPIMTGETPSLWVALTCSIQTASSVVTTWFGRDGRVNLVFCTETAGLKVVRSTITGGPSAAPVTWTKER